MTADAPRLPFNVREGVKRLLIVAAIASACSIGATTWKWLALDNARGYLNSTIGAELRARNAPGARDAAADAATGVPNPAGERILLAVEISKAAAEALEFRQAEFEAIQKWTVIGHLIALTAAILIWAVSGFVARQKAPLTAAADPHRLTGSADTGPPADKEG